MDWLKSEIDSKKRQLESIPTDTTANTKYLKRTDLDKAREQDRQLALQQSVSKYKQSQSHSTAASTCSTPTTTTKTTTTGKQGLGVDSTRSTSPATTATYAKDKGKASGLANPSTVSGSSSSAIPASSTTTTSSEGFNVSNEEAIRRLRHKGQPIRLFGESDKDRRLRLRALELIEERSEGQRNDFMKALENAEKGASAIGSTDQINQHKLAAAIKASADATLQANKDAAAAAGTDALQTGNGKDSTKEPNPKDEDVIVDVSLVKTNPHKVYPQIYHALKRVLKEWEQSLADRPESVRRSTQGKIAAATQQTSAEYLKPLFKSLRKRELAPDVLRAIAEITFYMQTREYLKANDSYLRLSIGNAPWPIGVTMVGIHERAGRSRIASDNVAHVLNDETSRKYIQSLKRLLTFAQTVRPPSDLSQLMG